MRRARAALGGLVIAGCGLAGRAAGVTGPDFADAARAQGLGGASAGIPGDPTLIWRDPVAASRLREWVASAGGSRTFAGASVWQALLAMPLGPRRLAAAVTGYSFGDVMLRSPDGLERAVPGRQDLAGLVGITTPLLGRWDGGASVKVTYSRLLEEVSTGSVAVDLGLAGPLGAGVTGGLAIVNLGTPLTYLAEPVPLDRIATAGVARSWRIPGHSAGSLMTVAGVDWRFTRGAAVGRIGAEYRWKELVALRAGWHRGSDREIGEPGFGVGVRVRGFRLDVGVQTGSRYAPPMTMSLTWFAPARARERGADPAASAPAPTRPPVAADGTAPEPPPPAAAAPEATARSPLRAAGPGPIAFYPATDRELRIPVRVDDAAEFGVELVDGDGARLATLVERRPVAAGTRDVVWDGTLGGAPVIRQHTYILRVLVGRQTLEYPVEVRDHE